MLGYMLGYTSEYTSAYTYTIYIYQNIRIHGCTNAHVFRGILSPSSDPKISRFVPPFRGEVCGIARRTLPTRKHMCVEAGTNVQRSSYPQALKPSSSRPQFSSLSPPSHPRYFATAGTVYMYVHVHVHGILCMVHGVCVVCFSTLV